MISTTIQDGALSDFKSTSPLKKPKSDIVEECYSDDFEEDESAAGRTGKKNFFTKTEPNK